MLILSKAMSLIVNPFHSGVTFLSENDMAKAFMKNSNAIPKTNRLMKRVDF